METLMTTTPPPIADQQKLDYFGPQNSTLRYWRHDGQLFAEIHRTDNTDAVATAAQQAFDEILELLLGPAKELPEVTHYFTLKQKDTGVAAELSRIDLELQQVELDRLKTIADASGEKLAAKLAKLEIQRQDLTARIQDCEEGARLFAQEVRAAEVAAETALMAHVEQLPTCVAEAKKRLATAEAAIGSAIGEAKEIFTAIGAAAAAAHTVKLIGDRDLVVPRLQAILAEVPEQTPKVATA
jgi:hypothetical protein